MGTPTTDWTVQGMATDDIRAELRALGRRRAQQVERDAELSTQIRDALARAEGQITRTEAADLLGLHRTTLYRVYRPERAA